jgi:hypothetical protein
MRHAAPVLAEPAAPSRARRRTSVLAAVLAIITATAMVAAAPAMAGKPSRSSGSSLSLVLLDSTDGQAHWGQRVTFTVSTTATTEPHVSLKCYQSSTLVYSTQTGYYASYPWPSTQIMTLSSGAWTGGAASCTAVLYWFNGSKTVTGSTLSFPVAA